MKWLGKTRGGCLVAALLVAGTHPGSGAELPDPSDTISPNEFFFDPVSVESPSARIRLTRLGSYRGGWFSNNTPTSAVYDRRTKRLFVGSVDRQAIEALDISDPHLPSKAFAVPIAPFGNEPNSITIHRGVLAVAVKTTNDPAEPSRILFFNAAGERLVSPIELDGVSRVDFTPNGRRLVATVSGGIDDETLRFSDSEVAVVDLGRVNWGACRRRPAWCRIEPRVRRAGFNAFDKEVLRTSGVRFVLSAVLSPLLPPGVELTTGQEIDVAGFDISDDSRYAYVSLQRNNALATVDLRRAEITEINALGQLDHAIAGFGMDVSDRDGAINIANWPLRSFPEPDKIAVIRSRGQKYILAVNEGDPFDIEVPAGTVLPDGTVLPEDTEFSEKARVKDLKLDKTAFPDAAELQENENLGRLQVSQIDGFAVDAGGERVFRELVTLGSRSLSTLTLDGRRVFDTGEAFERITEIAAFGQGLSFNAAEDENEPDKRSDDRGPEPEPLAIGRISNRSYAFVGFERVGGIVAYDVTKPAAPRFQQYINNRNFAVEPEDVCGDKGEPAPSTCAEVGDLEPEGILFISRRDSPIDAPLLAVVHELSDSTTLYRIDQIGDDDDDDDEDED